MIDPDQKRRDTIGERKAEDLGRALKTMLVVRAIATPWAFLQVVTYGTMPYPAGVEEAGFTLVAILAGGTLALWFWFQKVSSDAALWTLSFVSLAFDFALISGFVWLFSFDQITALWAIMFILPLEGAVLFQLEGAVGAWAAAAVSYAAREGWGSRRYGYVLEWNSVSFRMGIALVIALVAGMMARNLVRERTRLEAALDELQRVDRMRTMLVSALAHDVRNPLTAIRGVHKTLLTRGSTIDPEQAQHLLETADRQSHRLSRLATELLDLARLEQGRLDLAIEPVSVEAALRSAISYVAGAEDVSITVEPRDLVVAADSRRLQQILVNLVSNALEHGAPPFEVDARRVDGRVAIAFSDHGEGVAPDVRANLFEPFRGTGKTSVGLGLAVARGLAEAQAGTITYADNTPSGACFVLTLPNADGLSP